MIDNCPKCNACLIGEPIPKDKQQFYIGATHFRREIAVFDIGMDIYHRIKCPDCGAANYDINEKGLTFYLDDIQFEKNGSKNSL